MGEGIELPESHHEDHPLVLPVSITISIMAVFVAGASLLGPPGSYRRVAP